MLIVRDTQNRQIISDLQERLDNAHHASSSLATKNARGDNLRELEDELHIVRKSASEFRERIQAVNLELSSQQRLSRVTCGGSTGGDSSGTDRAGSNSSADDSARKLGSVRQLCGSASGGALCCGSGS